MLLRREDAMDERVGRLPVVVPVRAPRGWAAFVPRQVPARAGGIRAVASDVAWSCRS